MVAGAGSAALILVAVAWAMLRYSQTLPIAKFFTYSAWLMAALTVVLAGKGVSALQEAGIINIAPMASVPRVRSEEHTSELQSLMRNSNAVFCLQNNEVASPNRRHGRWNIH